jgi:hypothetical protein
MEACISCEGMIDAATRRCSRCGRAQPEPCAAESGSPSGGRDDGQAEAWTWAAYSHRLLVPSAAGKVTEPSAGGVMAEAAARPIEQEAPEEERPGDGRRLIEIFRDRRIDLKDPHLTSPLRLLIYAAFAQTVIVALLLLSGLKVSQPSVSSGVQDPAGGTFLVPTAVFIVMAISVAAGYCLVLAGALRVRAAAGLPIVAATTITLAVVPISKLHAGAAVEPHEWLRWAQLGVLAFLWAWVLWRLAARQWAGDVGGEHQSSGERKHDAVLVGVLAVVVAYYALEFVVWGSYAHQTARGTGFLLDDLSFQAVLLPVFLTLVVLLGSTDLLGWGELIAARVPARVTPSYSWIFLILTPLTACLVIANALRVHPGEALPELLVGAVLAGIVGLLIRLGTGYTGWSDDLRAKLVFAGAIVVFVYTTVFLSITEELATAAGLSSLADSELYWLISTPVLLALLTVGLFLVARGQVGNRKTGATGLFLAMVGMLILIVELPEFVSLRSRTLPGVIPWQHFSLLSGIQLAAGIGALVWVGWLLAHKRLSKNAVGPLPSIFLLLVGLELVTLIIDLLKGIENLGNHSAFALAGLFLLISFWGLITSGDQLNGKAASAHYPRDGRIKLFVGYTLIANATLVYLGTLRAPVTGTGPPDSLTADYVSPAGLGILGTALVVMAFVMRPRELARSSAPAAANRAEATLAEASPAAAGAASPVRNLAPVTIQRGILGAGALLTAVALTFVAVTAAPHLANASALLVSQPYRAFVPGPGCDEGGASWTVAPGDPITTNCLGATGLQVEDTHPGTGDVQFLLPGGPFPRNYRISVQVNLSHMPDGCASIYTRASAAGHYTSYICTNTLKDVQTYVWGIQEIGLKTFKQLGSGIVRKANTYVLEATAANTIQQITVDGSSAAFTSGTFAATEFVSLGISDSGEQGGSVIFSNFTFTPLPAQPPLSPSPALTPLPPLPPPSAGASPAPSAASIEDQVSAWFVNGGQAELDLLAARVDAVGLAATTTYAALGQACSALATAVMTTQADPPIPDPAAQVWLAKALNEFGRAAAICETAAASHSLTLVNEAAVPMRAATADIKQVQEITGHD